MRVTGVFTGTTSSPSPSLRQWPTRYTIRAGRNLPDKEFRSRVTFVFQRSVDYIFIQQTTQCFTLTSIHLARDARNVLKPLHCQVFTPLHKEKDVSKFEEINVLLC